MAIEEGICASEHPDMLRPMHPALNPFQPGSGRKPPKFAGRQAEIDAFDLLVARSRRQHLATPLILHGYRGVGKTVLLNALRNQAEIAGWLCIDLEGQPSESGKAAVRQRLGRRLHDAADAFKNGKVYSDSVRQAFATLTSFSESLGVSSPSREPASGRANSGQLEVDLEELIEDFSPALKESHSAIGVFIDEMQDIDVDLLSALITVQNRAGQKSIPFYVIGAGLPSLPSLLTSSRSYAERLFDYRHIGALSADAAAEALREPFTALNFRVDEEALDRMVKRAKGYPYFIQLFGSAAWDAAPTRHITVEIAELAMAEALKVLDSGIYQIRWERTTGPERKYLRSMALTDDETADIVDVEKVCDLGRADAVNARLSLIEKGIVFCPEDGYVAFTVPGMPAYIERQERG